MSAGVTSTSSPFTTLSAGRSAVGGLLHAEGSRGERNDRAEQRDEAGERDHDTAVAIERSAGPRQSVAVNEPLPADESLPEEAAERVVDPVTHDQRGKKSGMSTRI